MELWKTKLYLNMYVWIFFIWIKIIKWTNIAKYCHKNFEPVHRINLQKLIKLNIFISDNGCIFSHYYLFRKIKKNAFLRLMSCSCFCINDLFLCIFQLTFSICILKIGIVGKTRCALLEQQFVRVWSTKIIFKAI